MAVTPKFQLSMPTKSQLRHDLYLVVVAFIATGLTVWQVQPDKFGKAAAVAAITAGFAAVVTVIKSIFTTL